MLTISPDLAKLIATTNLAVNDDPCWVGRENFCAFAMAMKDTRLQAAGIPPAAMTPIVVDAGPRYRDDAHSLLKITGQTPDGEPWVRFLDINQPDLLTAADVAELGYIIL